MVFKTVHLFLWVFWLMASLILIDGGPYFPCFGRRIKRQCIGGTCGCSDGNCGSSQGCGGTVTCNGLACGGVAGTGFGTVGLVQQPAVLTRSDLLRALGLSETDAKEKTEKKEKNSTETDSDTRRILLKSDLKSAKIHGSVAPGDPCTETHECVEGAKCEKAFGKRYCVCIAGKRPKGPTCVEI